MDLQQARDIQAAAWRDYVQAVRTGIGREKASRAFCAAWQRVRKLEHKDSQRKSASHSDSISTQGDLPR